MANNVHRVHPAFPQAEIIDLAAAAIKSGRAVVFPTRTLYGLGVNAFDEEALDRLFEIKQRPADRPVSVLIRDRHDLAALVRDLSPAARHLMDALWPGRITVVLTACGRVPDRLTAGTGKIGVRMPEHAVAAALVAAVNGPITATSANLSNRTACRRIADLHPQIAMAADRILDAGPLEGGAGSTVVDMTGPTPMVLREGTISAAAVMEALGRGRTAADQP